MALIAILFTALGTAIASLLDDFQGFQLVMNFLVMPIFFLSGALFPLWGSEGPEHHREYRSFVLRRRWIASGADQSSGIRRVDGPGGVGGAWWLCSASGDICSRRSSCRKSLGPKLFRRQALIFCCARHRPFDTSKLGPSEMEDGDRRRSGFDRTQGAGQKIPRSSRVRGTVRGRPEALIGRRGW